MATIPMATIPSPVLSEQIKIVADLIKAQNRVYDRFKEPDQEEDAIKEWKESIRQIIGTDPDDPSFFLELPGIYGSEPFCFVEKLFIEEYRYLKDSITHKEKPEGSLEGFTVIDPAAREELIRWFGSLYLKIGKIVEENRLLRQLLPHNDRFIDVLLEAMKTGGEVYTNTEDLMEALNRSF